MTNDVFSYIAFAEGFAIVMLCFYINWLKVVVNHWKARFKISEDYGDKMTQLNKEMIDSMRQHSEVRSAWLNAIDNSALFTRKNRDEN